MDTPVVLSHYQTRLLLRARERGEASTSTSLDLGLTATELRLDERGVLLPSDQRVAWGTLRRIADSESKCFVIEGGEAREIQIFSAQTNWLRSLYPTEGAPTMLASGIPMHRIKGTDPWRDTLTKVAALAPIAGQALDTATGLGYTAIELARRGADVVTIELDPAALEVARANPWSRELFAQPRIQQIVGDAADVLPTLPDHSFARILHDPPMFSLAGDLYSVAFYQQLYRVIERKGRLFHYIGDPKSKSGQRTTAGVIRRLQEAGFGRVMRRPEAFGVLALP
jgi:predicted methyltransferase